MFILPSIRFGWFWSACSTENTTGRSPDRIISEYHIIYRVPWRSSGLDSRPQMDFANAFACFREWVCWKFTQHPMQFALPWLRICHPSEATTLTYSRWTIDIDESGSQQYEVKNKTRQEALRCSTWDPKKLRMSWEDEGRRGLCDSLSLQNHNSHERICVLWHQNADSSEVMDMQKTQRNASPTRNEWRPPIRVLHCSLIGQTS